MPRFLSWLAMAVAGAFLVVSTTAYSLSTISWLAFAISVGTLVVSVAVAYCYRRDVATAVIGAAAAVVSMWTIVASLVYPQATVENLALASGLAIAGLAIAGLAAHELSSERAIVHAGATLDERETRLAPAA